MVANLHSVNGSGKTLEFPIPLLGNSSSVIQGISDLAPMVVFIPGGRNAWYCQSYAKILDQSIAKIAPGGERGGQQKFKP